MIFIYYIFAVLLIYMSYKSYRGGVAYLEYFRSELLKPLSSFTPFATVIVPCKGLEDGLEDNLKMLFEQDYPAYEIIFVVDDENDPAMAVLRSISGRHGDNEPQAEIVIAQRSTDSSQKVENLRKAVLHASESSQVFVFADSDIRPQAHWLRYLIAPLEDKKIGAATGYRWFISEQPTLGSEMRSVWNASIASALGPNRKKNFCWGGSMAIRRETFKRIDMREKWRGALSDDFAVTRAIKAAGLEIYFVPQALTASVGNFSLWDTIEFTNRQMKITRVNAPDLWRLSFFGSAMFNAVMISSILIALFSKSTGLNALIALLVLLAVSIFSTAKSWLRLKAVEIILAARRPQIKKQRLAQNTLWLLSPAIFLINCITATFSRKMTWRGIRYELKSPNETVIITD